MFKDATGVVTGSTSGIGLGIATSLAAKGVNVVLNGSGDAGDIETLRAKLAADHRVKVRYDGADLSKQDAIESMMRSAIASSAASTSHGMIYRGFTLKDPFFPQTQVDGLSM